MPTLKQLLKQSHKSGDEYQGQLNYCQTRHGSLFKLQFIFSLIYGFWVSVWITNTVMWRHTLLSPCQDTANVSKSYRIKFTNFTFIDCWSRLLWHMLKKCWFRGNPCNSCEEKNYSVLDLTICTYSVFCQRKQPMCDVIIQLVLTTE